MDIELRNDRIPRNPFDRQFLDMSGHRLENSGLFIAVTIWHMHVKGISIVDARGTCTRGFDFRSWDSFLASYL